MPRPPRMDLTEEISSALEGTDLSGLETFELDQEGEEAPEEAQPDDGQDPEEDEEVPSDDDSDEEESDEEVPEDAPGDEDLDGTPDDEDRETDEAEASADEDVPDSFMGLDLSEVPVEKRKEIIERFKEQDRYANREHQRAKELEKELQSQDPEPPAPEPSPKTDEEILAALGYDPEDEMFAIKAEVALPLAKQVLTLQQGLQSLLQERAIDQFEQHWNSTLDRLEDQHGSLPIERDELLEFAADNDINDAETAYLKYMTPRKKALSDEVAQAKKEAVRNLKKKATTARPRTAPVKTKPKDAKNMKEAFKQVETEQGVDMDKLVKNLARSL